MDVPNSLLEDARAQGYTDAELAEVIKALAACSPQQIETLRRALGFADMSLPPGW